MGLLGSNRAAGKTEALEGVPGTLGALSHSYTRTEVETEGRGGSPAGAESPCFFS